MQLGVVDILVLVALVVVVASLFLRFRLPKDDRPKAERRGWQELVEKFQPKKAEPQPEMTPLPAVAQNARNMALRAKGKLVVPKGLGGVPALKAVDPTFTEAGFTKGAKDAYQFFHEKWAAGDEDELAHLCAPRLLDALSDGELGKAPGKVAEIKTVKITGARLNGRTAIVDVNFEAKHGNKLLKSHWTLARAVGGLDPNWELQSLTTKK